MTIKKNNKFLFYITSVIASFLIFFVRLIYIKDLNGPIVFEDELGYWTHAANMNGLNWSNTLNMWYSFGYSFILAPIFKFTHDMALMYKIGVVINAIFAVMGFWLGMKLVDQLEPELPDMAKLLIGFTPMMYSAYMLQSNICWSETFLYTWIILTTVIVLQFFSKPTVLWSVLSAFTLSFSFIIHNRALVPLMAFVLVALLFIIRRKFPLPSIIAFTVTVVLVFLGYKYFKGVLRTIEYNSDYILKYNIQSDIETGVEVYSADDFVGNNITKVTGRIKTLLSWTGIKALIKSALGTLWYFNVGTLGLAFLGICELGIQFYKKLKSKKNIEGILFILLSFLGTAGLNTIMHTSPQLGKNPERLDNYFYGRYVDQITSILIILGLFMLLKMINNALNGTIKLKHIISVLLCISVHAVSSYFIQIQVKPYPVYFVVRTCAASIFYKEEYDAAFYSKLGYACFIALIVLCLILFLVSRLIKNKTDNISKTSIVILFLTIICFSIWSMFITYNNYSDDTLNNQRYRDLTLPAAQVINQDRNAPLFFYAGCDYYYLRTVRTKCADNEFFVGIPDSMSFMDGIDHAYFIIPFGVDPAFFPPGQIDFLYDNCELVLENQNHGIFEYKAK
ncbi:MAG: hypothetical protein MJ172_05430 [Clostridia bacterium]|nr:hypothetical protein [Clostridia bacterium]